MIVIFKIVTPYDNTLIDIEEEKLFNMKIIIYITKLNQIMLNYFHVVYAQNYTEVLDMIK